MNSANHLINSPQWWEDYFREQWEHFGGPDQTSHFMSCLLKSLPEEDHQAIRDLKLSVLDWGCAMGQGTHLLNEAFPDSIVSGCDVSSTALSNAKTRYPSLVFQDCSGSQIGTLPRMSDVVVNSNCLEHFANPMAIVSRSLASTKHLFIAMVPSQEEPLSEHHLISFEKSSFPARLGDFERVFLHTVSVDKTFWPSGEQLLVGYASQAYIALRTVAKKSVAERNKWDSYYKNLALIPVDAPTEAFNRELCEALSTILKPGSSVLEAGCGGGSQSLALAKAGFDVSLLDFSQPALDYAKRLFESENQQANFVRDDAFAIRSANYDLVFNAGVLEHYTLDEQAAFLKGMASRSKRFVLVLIPNSSCYWYWLWRIRKAADQDWPFGMEMPLNDLRDAFELAGIQYLGQAFLGASWTESFIQSQSGASQELKDLILQVHRSPIVGAETKGYLLAALGTVNQENVLDFKSSPFFTTAFDTAGRANEWKAVLADALSLRIAAENNVSLLSQQHHEKELDLIQTREKLLTVSAQLEESRRHAVALTDWTTNKLLNLDRVDEAEKRAEEAQKNALALEKDLDQSRSEKKTLSSLVSTQASELALQSAQISRLSNWASDLNRRGLKWHLKHQTKVRLKRVYQKAPLPVSVRRKMSAWWHQRNQARMLNSVAQVDSSSYPAAAQQEQSVRILRPALAARGEHDYFFFAVIDWDFRIQRPQHLAKALSAETGRLFYISNNFVDNSTAGFEVSALDNTGKLFRISLHLAGSPAIYFASPTAQQLKQLSDSLAQLLSWVNPDRCIGVVQHPFWCDLTSCLPNATVIYDCMDHHNGFGNVPQSIEALEKKLITQCDQLIVTSAWLEDHMKEKRPDLCVIRNACDYSHFAAKPAAIYQDKRNRKILGYFGAIAEWFDIELIRKMSAAYPEHLILLIGNDSVSAQSQLSKCNNVEFTGEIPYESLPYYLHAFDVCLLPFKVEPLTLATNPVKVYEYLCAGKPVVSIALPELAQFGALVACANNASEFVEKIRLALTEQNGEIANNRKKFASEQTWQHRADQIRAQIRCVKEPRVSIIVLTYNNLDLTQACLNSVIERSDYSNLELIVVDNLSTDGSREWLTEWAKNRDNCILILNDTNSGFAKGNNIGLKKATGEYLVVLNNDTQVTDGWVRTMTRHFKNNKALGLLGPITNNIGNESKIAIDYDSPKDMPAAAKEITLANAGREYEVAVLAFFCTMIRRSVYEQIGGLCEEYGLGFFEDDDYCKRVAAKGWQILCADDVFVHHHLSASFAKLPSAQRVALFETNKATYESKWGAWIAHEYRPAQFAVRRPKEWK